MRILFYLTAGLILASITWSSIEHSVVSDDPVLSVILLATMFFIVGQYFVDRWRPEHAARDFHPTKLWKMPFMAASSGLWLRVVYRTLTSVAVYAGVAAILVLSTTAQLEFMTLLGILLVLRMPHLYWSMRSRYEQVELRSSDGTQKLILRYKGGSELHRATHWLMPTLMAGMGAAIAVTGMLLH